MELVKVTLISRMMPYSSGVSLHVMPLTGFLTLPSMGLYKSGISLTKGKREFHFVSSSRIFCILLSSILVYHLALHQELFVFIRWALLHHATPLGWGVPKIKDPQRLLASGAHYLGDNPTLKRYPPYTKLVIKYSRRKREETRHT